MTATTSTTAVSLLLLHHHHHRTAQYNLSFYLQYLARWPEYCLAAAGPGGATQGYVLGKVEGEGRLWHGHVTAVTVAPAYRRQRLAGRLMAALERVTAERCVLVACLIAELNWTLLTSALRFSFLYSLVSLSSASQPTTHLQPTHHPPARPCSHDAYFVDLFVRASNAVAVGMYERLGYSVYRRVLGYYANGEDALGGWSGRLGWSGCGS